ncbi:MAG: LTA synthase family protein [Alteromonadaceae bacterium]|nr:LTA synthase family protein [Alteromonadaceae bacterium]
MLVAVFTGLLLSLLISILVNPTGQRPRLPGLYALLAGSGWWLVLFGLVCLLSQRPYFSMAFVVVWHGVLLAVNHAKFAALKEPFILQDFEYFTDALRHPQLYVPFFGVAKTVALLAAGAVAIGAFLWLETPLHQSGDGLLLPVASLATGILASLAAWRIRPELTLDPTKDMRQTGLIALLHSHLAEYWQARKRTMPKPADNWPEFAPGKPKPNLVLVQSESFFDPRSCYSFIEPSVLTNWDEHKKQAANSGQLDVPAWGANTVRTEAAVLAGLSPGALGIHQYNPYRRLAKQPTSSLASHLRAQGYETVCIHPYPASFYFRHRIMPALGFDHFIDIAAFSESDRCGQYIGDQAVGNKIRDYLENTDKPVFIFAITMENHGPLHLEQPEPDAGKKRYTRPPGGAVSDLSVYLRHLENADQMLKQTTNALEAANRSGSLCWYGDHVPIMADVYRDHGEPAPTTPWLIWTTETSKNTRAGDTANQQPLPAHGLAKHWLTTLIQD